MARRLHIRSLCYQTLPSSLLPRARGGPSLRRRQRGHFHWASWCQRLRLLLLAKVGLDTSRRHQGTSSSHDLSGPRWQTATSCQAWHPSGGKLLGVLSWKLWSTLLRPRLGLCSSNDKQCPNFAPHRSFF